MGGRGKGTVMPDDDVVAAVAKLTEAVELIEAARERLCDVEALVACAGARAQEATRRLGRIADGRAPDAFLASDMIAEFDDRYYCRIKALEHEWRERLLLQACEPAVALAKRR